jgi:hypothetical protein
MGDGLDRVAIGRATASLRTRPPGGGLAGSWSGWIYSDDDNYAEADFTVTNRTNQS